MGGHHSHSSPPAKPAVIDQINNCATENINCDQSITNQGNENNGLALNDCKSDNVNCKQSIVDGIKTDSIIILI